MQGQRSAARFGPSRTIQRSSAEDRGSERVTGDCRPSRLRGRTRGQGPQDFSGAERARSAVTKCIKKAIRKICEAIPSLGYHLAVRIKTGYFCSYNPHPDRPVAWKFCLEVLIFLPLSEL